MFWYLSPLVSLVIFLGYSAIHFGRDWSKITSFGGAPYGCLVIGLPACFHPVEIQSIYQMITADLGAGHVLTVNWIFIICVVTYLLMTLLVGSLRRLPHYAWLEALSLTACAYLCSPLWYFVIFFCILHSPRHLISELGSLTESHRIKAIIVMVVITIITLGFVALFGVQLRVELSTLETFTYQAIFIGLSVLTVPHMLLMEWVRYDTARALIDAES
jgi:Brp/Blh family beta-carotene 15,15'-monooxygenase